MPATQILSVNQLTQKAWPLTFFQYVLQNMLFTDMIGTGDSDMPILIDRTLVGRPGDQVIFELDKPLVEAGGYDDSTIEGNEESMTFWNMPIVVHERSHGVISAGIMTDKRSAVKILRKAFYALTRWAAEQFENDLIYAMCGLGNQGKPVDDSSPSEIETVNPVEPSSGRIIYGGQTSERVYTTVANDASLGAGGATNYKNHLFGTKVIEAMRVAAQLATPKIQPVLVNGKYYYILVMHPLQRKALRRETGEQGWSHIVATAQQRGIGNWIFGKEGQGKERMFNGAIGVWDDVILYESERLPTRIYNQAMHDKDDKVNSYIASGTARVARCVLLGAKAVCVAWGQEWRRHTKEFDYGRKPGTATDAIYGVRKTNFRDPGVDQDTNTPGEDYGVLVHDTCVEEA